MATTKNITMKQFNGTDYDTLYPKTKLEQVEGAYTQQQILANSTKALFGLGSNAVPDDLFKTLGAELRVTTGPKTVVSASKDGVTLHATADSSGLAILKIPRFGIWTISITNNGVSLSKDCEIKAIAQYEMVLSTNLEIASWDNIDSISKSGNAASLWSVGDKKTININGTNYKVQIIGFNHDDKTTGGKAGITFQMVDCLNTTYGMNSSNTTDGGWKNSAMRNRMSTFLGQLPSDLRSVIKNVNKLTSAGSDSATINTTSDKLFLLSEVEIFGSNIPNIYSYPGEGSQYAYYKAGNTKVKKVNGSANYWWERSPNTGGTYFCCVNSRGGNFSDTPIANNGVSFAFCV